jgi:hypothetical protein
MTTKKIFLIIILLTVTAVLFGEEEEALFKAIKNTPVWYNKDKGCEEPNENIAFVLKKGETVTGSSIAYYKNNINDHYVYVNLFTDKNHGYYNRPPWIERHDYLIQTDMLIPAATSSLFDDLWITIFDSNDKVFWIRDYYLSVLFSKNRDTFYDFEYKFIDSCNALRKAMGIYYITEEEWEYNIKEEWYEYTEIKRCLEINQTTMYAGGIGNIKRFWIKDIININNGYKITVIYPKLGGKVDINDPYDYNSILFPTDKSSFNLLLIRDNNYVDMYLENMENKLATFVLVDKTVVDELNNLLKNNTCDLSKITSLPRRADGSMDYQPPELLSDTNDTVFQALPKNNADKTSLPLWAWFVFIGIALAVSGGVAAVIVVLRKKAR